MSGGLTCHAVGFSHSKARDGTRPVLDGVEAHFSSGQITWISGPTGAGKSTLLHLLAGLRRPCRGEVRADGQPVSRWLASHRDRWRRQLGIIFQHDRLVPDLTVLENVMLPLIPRASRLRELRDRARHVLAQVDLSDGAGRLPTELSGGERQRAAAARALVVAPRFLLADEPFAHQDETHARTLHGLFRARARAGAVVIVAAHGETLPDREDIDRHWQLTDGRLEAPTCPSTPC
jgi:ABC-type ATPase involved in cell division